MVEGKTNSGHANVLGSHPSLAIEFVYLSQLLLQAHTLV
jgi:hypothetical protein